MLGCLLRVSIIQFIPSMTVSSEPEQVWNAETEMMRSWRNRRETGSARLPRNKEGELLMVSTALDEEEDEKLKERGRAMVGEVWSVNDPMQPVGGGRERELEEREEGGERKSQDRRRSKMTAHRREDLALVHESP